MRAYAVPLLAWLLPAAAATADPAVRHAVIEPAGTDVPRADTPSPARPGAATA